MFLASLLSLLLLPACTWVPTGEVDRDADGFMSGDDCDDADPEFGAPSDWYLDDDGDGYGSDEIVQGCTMPEGAAIENGDCDPSDAAAYPGATETCDGIDNDCDGAVDGEDSDLDGGSTYFVDSDGDGYGDPSATITACEPSKGIVADNTDCDDADLATHPDATEIPGDEIDEDCDETEICYVDVDNDDYRADETTVASKNIDCSDVGEASATDPDGDCDDSDDTFNPGVAEIFSFTDETDENCDGLAGFFADDFDDGIENDAISTEDGTGTDADSCSSADIDTAAWECCADRCTASYSEAIDHTTGSGMSMYLKAGDAEVGQVLSILNEATHIEYWFYENTPGPGEWWGWLNPDRDTPGLQVGWGDSIGACSSDYYCVQAGTSNSELASHAEGDWHAVTIDTDWTGGHPNCTVCVDSTCTATDLDLDTKVLSVLTFQDLQIGVFIDDLKVEKVVGK